MTPRALRLLLLCLLASPAGEAAAAFSRDYAGTSGGQFLKLPIDARGAAMGGAMAAGANDVSALHWNPAGLAGVASRQVMVSYLPYVAGAGYGFLGFAQPLETLFGKPRRELSPAGLGTLAVGLVYLNAGNIQEIDNAGQSTGGSFTPTDLAIVGGWGGAVARVLDLGVAVKIVRSQIQASASTAAGDAGMRLRLRAGPVPWAVSAGVHNTFGHLKFHDQVDPLPATFHFGFAAELLPVLTYTLDAVAPRDNRPYACMGTEVAYAVDRRLGFAVRAGYNGMTTRGQLEGTAGFSLGAGIGVYKATFDYAWQPFGVLGEAHRLTFSYRW